MLIIFLSAWTWGKSALLQGLQFNLIDMGQSWISSCTCALLTLSSDLFHYWKKCKAKFGAGREFTALLYWYFQIMFLFMHLPFSCMFVCGRSLSHASPFFKDNQSTRGRLGMTGDSPMMQGYHKICWKIHTIFSQRYMRNLGSVSGY